MRILFSPIGDSDPVKNLHDGPMIHICRHKLPDIVYLFLSKEMVAQNSDDRYIKSIRLLEENLSKKGTDHKFDVKLINGDIDNVHRFDDIYKKFKQELDKIAKENEGAEIILNVSSGTPAMNSVLQIIASLSDRYIAYQVTNPDNRSNRDEAFELEPYWDNNADAIEETSYRVLESPYMNFLSEIEGRIILKHVKVYDYEAAWRVFNDSEQKKDNLHHLLLAAKKRIHLDRDGAEEELKKVKDLDVSILPKKGEDGELIEYLMWLQTKQERKDYSDFIRGITPAFSYLCRRILIKKGIKINRDFMYGKTFLYKELPSGKTVAEIIQGDSQFISSGILVSLIEECKLENDEILRLVHEIREVEKKVRNKCAHEIVEITDSAIKDTAGKNVSEIMGMLKKLAFLVFKIGPEDLNAYRVLNELIEKELNLS